MCEDNSETAAGMYGQDAGSHLIPSMCPCVTSINRIVSGGIKAGPFGGLVDDVITSLSGGLPSIQLLCNDERLIIYDLPCRVTLLYMYVPISKIMFTSWILHVQRRSTQVAGAHSTEIEISPPN